MKTIEQNRYVRLETDTQRKLVELILKADEVELEAIEIMLKALVDGYSSSHAAALAAEYLMTHPGYEQKASNLMHGGHTNE